MWPSIIGVSNSCKSKQCHMTSKSCKNKQCCTMFKSCKIKQCYCVCLLHISFLFNFLVVNFAKHNDQQVFHLDFTSTLKIGKSQLPILLVKQAHVRISNLSMLLLSPPNEFLGAFGYLIENQYKLEDFKFVSVY